jgi:hypothetical protein
MRFIKTFFIGTIATFIIGDITSAANTADPVVGTWVINLAKSKYSSPDRVPKSQTRTYTQSADGTSLSIQTVTADGASTTQQSTFRYDGKPYAFTGSSLYDSLTLKQVDTHTVKSTQWKDGKETGETTRVLSADGKAMSVTTTGKDAKGMPYRDESVYDRKQPSR